MPRESSTGTSSRRIFSHFFEELANPEWENRRCRRFCSGQSLGVHPRSPASSFENSLDWWKGPDHFFEIRSIAGPSEISSLQHRHWLRFCACVGWSDRKSTRLNSSHLG